MTAYCTSRASRAKLIVIRDSEAKTLKYLDPSRKTHTKCVTGKAAEKPIAAPKLASIRGRLYM